MSINPLEDAPIFAAMKKRFVYHELDDVRRDVWRAQLEPAEIKFLLDQGCRAHRLSTRLVNEVIEPSSSRLKQEGMRWWFYFYAPLTLGLVRPSYIG